MLHTATRIFVFSALFIFTLFSTALADRPFTQENNGDNPFPFSTDETNITVWNGEEYVPLFIKGMNMGVAVPGTFPGELAATSEDYRTWFRQIRDAGFNTIRVYTLHFPRFYEELKRFNEENPNYPIYVFHGVWLEEEVPGYNEDLFTLTDLFDQEMRDNVRSIHGNHTIAPRQGKAYGTFTADISPWVIGYIVGREIHPPEVLLTNELHSSVTSYEGVYLSIEDTNPTEAWLLERMDKLLQYEMDNFGTMRPISASSWPTLDPLDHPFEENEYEVSASVDFQNVDISNAPAGFFISYHAYPYYPDYISRDPRYTPFFDHLGQNSYLGYLTYLKAHYERFPLIIAEFGGSSSWGVAKYAHSGIHHGGYSEREQGENTVRMFKNIYQSGAGGGMQFAWIDEWFKRTWITDPLDFDIERRIIWHNATAAEQNFGIIGYRAPDSNMELMEDFCTDCPVERLHTASDYSYLKLRLDIPEHIGEADTVWIALDTYDADLGESILPNGQAVSNRAEFALMITNFKAELFVTEAYDTFAKWFGTSGDEQLFRSIATDGAPWRLVRWKNNPGDEEVQDIGSLRVNRLDMPQHSNDGVRLKDDRIEVRIPWTLLNVTDPSQRRVLHDDRSTPQTETRISDGVAFAIQYGDFFVETTGRYEWPVWNHALDAVPYEKDSYFVIQEALPRLPGNPIAVSDHYNLGTGGVNEIPAELGVMVNDLSLDGTPMFATLSRPTLNGTVQLYGDGSFTYTAREGFTGTDSFTYRVRAGANWSEPVTVTLDVDGDPVGRGFVTLYPNPATHQITIESNSVIDKVEIYTILGRRVALVEVGSLVGNVSVDGLAAGVYYARIHSGRETQIKKFTRIH
ncbi:MAG: T9SS type A sorting domain-containing protein [Balneolia bacterium]|nr:T9SS type A sorting domain-containing protein [Balneolia bacterium]